MDCRDTEEKKLFTAKQITQYGLEIIFVEWNILQWNYS